LPAHKTGTCTAAGAPLTNGASGL